MHLMATYMILYLKTEAKAAIVLVLPCINLAAISF